MKLHRLTAQLVVGAILTLPVWVHAAGLGKLTVRSALGQPLSAEIELLVADKAELDSLNASLASGQAFKDAQIEYAPVLSTLQFAIGKGAGGRPVLKLTSNKPVNDPFMDMLIELNWASGRLLREYTILLDPPGVAVPQTVSPVAVSVPVDKAEPAAEPAPSQPADPGQYAATPAPAAEKPAAQARPAKQEAAAAEKAVPLESSVRVKRGDTLAQIANRVRPSSISLEQALVSLFNENQDAFQDKNMNRLKSGRSLKVPSVETMAAVDAQAARREINLQAADWQAYRARLAESVADQPAQEKEAPSKTVVGKITPKVEDKAQPKPEAAQDVLKLSKAAVPPVAAAKPDQAAAQKAAQEKALAEQKARAEQEDRIAKEKAAKEAAERAAALEKQIQDMKKLAEMKDKAAAAAPAAEAVKPPAEAAPKVKKALPPPVQEAQASWYDELLENPIYWIGGLIVVALGGLLWWMVAGGRLRRKKMSEAVTDSLMTGGGEMQPAGVAAGAAATGGVVNTGDTSFLTDFSQAGLAEIDTHDVDPIAEADVYMAYGRDAQAEEILKEALTKVPERHEIRLKLLEIYAARKNVTAFETVAGELYTALGGQTGAVWDKAVEMGRAIDPHNPLYGGTPEPSRSPVAEVVPAAVAPVVAAVAASAEAAAEPESTETAGALLDFTPEAPELDMDFNVPSIEEEAKAEAPAPAPAEAKHGEDLDFDLSGFDLKVAEAAPASEPAAAAGAMDFSGLDLSLGDVGGEDEFDEVATKLDLARAYLEMGDKEGAREILQEVISEGNARQKSDAQGIMAAL